MIDIKSKVRIVHSGYLLNILSVNDCPYNLLLSDILPLEIIPRCCAESTRFLGDVVIIRENGKGEEKSFSEDLCENESSMLRFA